MYHCWNKTQDHYLGVLKYLSGVDIESVMEAHPSAHGKVFRMQNNDRVLLVRRFGKLLCKVCCSESIGQLEALASDVERLLGSIGDGSVPEFSGEFSERQQSMVLWLKRGLSLVFHTVRQEFPAVIPFNDLRKLLIPSDLGANYNYIEGVKKMQCVVPGGALAVPPDKFIKCSSDTELFDMLATVCGKTCQWPDYDGDTTVLKIRYKQDDPVSVLIDSDNFWPSQVIEVLKFYIPSVVVKNSSVALCVTYPLRCDLSILLNEYPQVEVVGGSCVKASKSQTDFVLRDEVSRRYYCDGVRRFVIVSSDSDFSGLIEQYPDAEFYFVLQHSCTAGVWEKELNELNIPHVFVDESFKYHNKREYDVRTIVSAAYMAGLNGKESREEFTTFVNSNALFNQSVIGLAKIKLRSYIACRGLAV